MFLSHLSAPSRRRFSGEESTVPLKSRLQQFRRRRQILSNLGITIGKIWRRVEWYKRLWERERTSCGFRFQSRVKLWMTSDNTSVFWWLIKFLETTNMFRAFVMWIKGIIKFHRAIFIEFQQNDTFSSLAYPMVMQTLSLEELPNILINGNNMGICVESIWG